MVMVTTSEPIKHFPPPMLSPFALGLSRSNKSLRSQICVLCNRNMILQNY